jgi:hypothetical protein
MKRKKMMLLSMVVFSLVVFTGIIFVKTGIVESQTMPFGTNEDVEYSKRLWQVLVKEKLVGPNAIQTLPYEGKPPHGVVLETLVSTVTVNGNTGPAYVKANYGGKDITRSKVANNRQKYLKSVTVMYKREKGYDSDNQDWYWVKYTPDGGLHKNPKGMRLAGRVAKGKKKGCIACHIMAEGDDYLYQNDAAQLDRE